MANKIIDKFSASAAMTITLASLASAAARQSDLISNSSAREQLVRVFVKIKMGTSPTSNRTVQVHLLTGDGDATPHRSDGAGASDAAITLLNAPVIGVMRTRSSAATGDDLYGEFLVRLSAPEWGIAIYNDSGAAFNSTGSNSWVRYVYVSPEIQNAA